jgi:hypothetical protein
VTQSPQAADSAAKICESSKALRLLLSAQGVEKELAGSIQKGVDFVAGGGKK